MGLWCCLKLDPEDRFEENQERELFPYESPQGYVSGMGGKPKGKGKGDKGKGVRDTVANSIVPGSGLACEERVAWVNALAFDLRKLARGEQGYFYCMWVGFDEEYYSKAAARKEYTNRFNCNFFMQLASDAFISSNPGLLYGGSRGGCRLEFPSDMQTIQKEEPEPAVRINRDGGVAILAKSTPIVMKQLGDPLVEDILSPDTPDDQCLTLTLRNKDGTVADVKCRKPVEVIRDPDHPLVKQWMANHGKGTEGYLP